MFSPGINIGDKLTNDDVRKVFQCGMMGGMRRSRKTNTLVIISDETKGLYRHGKRTIFPLVMGVFL